MVEMTIHNRKYLKLRRKNLRNNLTSAEATLWRYLKKSQLKGRKFRRQHSICNYIVDFYCPREKLVVELDGEHHFSSSGYQSDTIRDEFLAKLNIVVLRFENDELFHDIDSVLAKIEEKFTTPDPS